MWDSCSESWTITILARPHTLHRDISTQPNISDFSLMHLLLQNADVEIVSLFNEKEKEKLLRSSNLWLKLMTSSRSPPAKQKRYNRRHFKPPRSPPKNSDGHVPAQQNFLHSRGLLQYLSKAILHSLVPSIADDMAMRHCQYFQCRICIRIHVCLDGEPDADDCDDEG